MNGTGVGASCGGGCGGSCGGGLEGVARGGIRPSSAGTFEPLDHAKDVQMCEPLLQPRSGAKTNRAEILLREPLAGVLVEEAAKLAVSVAACELDHAGAFRTSTFVIAL